MQRPSASRKVRCLVCSKVSPPGAACEHCNAPFPENKLPPRIKYPRPYDVVVAFISCPQCSRLLRRDVTSCPDCHTTITPAYAQQSIDVNVKSTQAFLRAEHIESLKPAAFLSVATAALITLIADFFGPASLVWLLVFQLCCCLVWLFTIVRWVDTFTSPGPKDNDLMAAFGKVRSAFWMWLAAMLAQVAALFTLIRTH